MEQLSIRLSGPLLLQPIVHGDQRGFFLTSNALGTTPNPKNFVLLHDVNKSWAAFGQASYALTDKLTLTGGVRVTRDTKTTDLLEHPNSPTLAVPSTKSSSPITSIGTSLRCAARSTVAVSGSPPCDTSLSASSIHERMMVWPLSRGS